MLRTEELLTVLETFTLDFGYLDDYFSDRVSVVLVEHLLPLWGEDVQGRAGDVARALHALAWQSAVSFLLFFRTALEDVAARISAGHSVYQMARG